MMIVIVDFATAPEHATQVRQTLQAEAPTVRALPGNQSFGFWPDPDHPGTWRLMHEWVDAGSFAAYRATPAFKAVGEVLFPLMTGKPQSRVFTADMVS
ncbi:MAG: putative quinol monooxygenase [Paracoccaceae bacterium]